LTIGQLYRAVGAKKHRQIGGQLERFVQPAGSFRKLPLYALFSTDQYALIHLFPSSWPGKDPI